MLRATSLTSTHRHPCATRLRHCVAPSEVWNPPPKKREERTKQSMNPRKIASKILLGGVQKQTTHWLWLQVIDFVFTCLPLSGHGQLGGF